MVLLSLFRFGRLVPVFLLAAAQAFAATSGTIYPRVYTSPVDGARRTYDLRTPKGYTEGAKVPAVLFLHGRGGWTGSFKHFEYFDAADAGGYALIFWQGRPDPNGLFSSYYIDAANGIPDESDILACLDEALAHFAIDPARVHLVGFSQGAKGALLVGLKNPDRFASIAEGAGPTDAFQGQKWSPTFPDFRDAAGGDPSAGGAVLARWFAQSPRFYLSAARNLPIALFHGGIDGVVPDSPVLFRFRNTHHVADTPGFSDENGVVPTLAELHAADPGGYPFETHYPAGVGHDELGLLDPATLFAFFPGKSVPQRPDRVASVTWEPGAKSVYWARLARATPPDGRPAAFTASVDASSNRLTLASPVDAPGAPAAPPIVTVDLGRAGLDASRRLVLNVTGTLALELSGAFPARIAVEREGSALREGSDFTRTTSGLALPLAAYGSPSLLTIAPAVVAPVIETDLLVPALVDASGLNGARFSTEIVLANLGAEAVTLDALLLDDLGRSTTLQLPSLSTRSFTSAAIFAALGMPGGSAPLRLRASAGSLDAIAGSARVVNTVAGGGTYGLSFPIARAGASVVVPGGDALLIGGSPARPERMNVSLFAPFEAASGWMTFDVPGGPKSDPLGFSLEPGERRQLNDVFSAFPKTAASVRLHVSSGRVSAYATVVSNSPTNDPFRSPTLPLAAGATEWTVPTVAAATGRNAAFFSSDLYLMTADGAPETFDVTLAFQPHAGLPTFTYLTLAAGQLHLLSDVVRKQFPQRVPDYGALVIRSAVPILAFAVTRSDAPAGASSQDLPCVPAGREITAAAPAAFVGLAQSPLARSNLTLVNRGAATSVALSLVTEEGDQGTRTIPLGAGEFRQLDSVAVLFTAAPTSAATLVVTPAAGSQVVASVARIDNETNDPTGLAPQTISPAH